MITANQLRAARALLNIDQRQMAELAFLSVPTIELINPGVASSTGGRGVRLREHVTTPKLKTVRQQKLSSSRALERAR